MCEFNYKNKKARILFSLIFTAFLAFYFGCTNKKEKQQKLASVFIKKVKREQIADVLTYPARVYSKINASILSETHGIISQQLVQLGQKVKIRQPLMIVTHTDPVYKYAPVQILAPIEGIVSSIEVTPGTHVTEGQILATVINPAQIELQTEVPSEDLLVIKKGISGTFTITSQERPHQVKIFGISPFVKPNTGTASAKLKITAFMGQILSPGVQGQVSFKTHEHSGFLIPNTAIVYESKKTFVKILENKKIKKIPVELGTKQRNFIEVLKGLQEGIELVERSSRSASEGESVIIENSAESQKELQTTP